MPDVIMGKTNVDAVSMEIIVAEAQSYLQQGSVLVPTIMDFSAFAVRGSDTVKVPRAGGFTVVKKASGTAVDAQALTYATDDIALNQHAVVQILLEKYASLQSQVAAELDMAQRAGLDLAHQVDKDILAQAIQASAATPDHRIAYAGSGLAEADILEAKRLLDVQKVPLSERVIVLPPAQVRNALGIANFVQADRYGSALPLMTGELGMAYGFRFIMHTATELGNNCIAYHRSHVGIAMQQALEYDTDKDLPNLATRHSFDQIYGVRVMDAGRRGVLIGSAT